jgi:CheY-like chemotaxis protein
LVLAATVWFNYRTGRAELEQQTNARAMAQIRAAARQVDDFIAHMGMLPRSTASRQEAVGRDPDPGMVPLTAHATMEEKQRCLASGMNDHISKPIDPNNLFETVGRFYKPSVATDVSPRQPTSAEAGADSTRPPCPPTCHPLPASTRRTDSPGLQAIANYISNCFVSSSSSKGLR